MSRIRKAYEARFRSVLQEFGARRLESGVSVLSQKAQEVSESQSISLPRALADVYARLAMQRAHYLAHHVRRSPTGPPAFEKTPVFLCDAGLGGLARWLRAAGYEARWRA